MPRIIVTPGAARGLERCRQFLTDKNPLAARRAATAIKHQLMVLSKQPEIGRPDPDMHELRELVIEFGDSGYIALYRYEPNLDAVFVLAIRHHREAGY